MSNPHWILVDKEVVPASYNEWRSWLRDANRTVKETFEGDKVDNEDVVRVCTTFLVFSYEDVSPQDRGNPLIFETYVFSGEHRGKWGRYRTWKLAEMGHKAVCKMVFGKKKGG